MDPHLNGSRRLQVFERLLRLLEPRSLLDLGAGHGKFSLLAADEGVSVTAVDARDSRFPSDPRVEWRVDDIRNVDLGGYDVIACLGLFYHLTLDDQISLLERCFPTALIIDTHLDQGHHEHAKRLSGRVVVDGYEGRWYSEPGAVTSSWGNPKSFWPTHEAFLRMLELAGYDLVMAVEPWLISDRTFFVALSRAAPATTKR
jgi:SAM-dependent methyltransferase